MAGRRNQKSATALAMAGLTVVLTYAGCTPANKYVPPPPASVTVSLPERRPVTSYAQFTGTTKAIETVDLRARVKGFLKKVDFTEAAEVKEGQLLMVIEEEPYQAKAAVAKARLDEAEASLQKAEESKARQVAQAQLALDQAMLMLAQVEERRNRSLLARNAASREDLDKSEATTKKSAAQVEADKASLEQANADFETNILAARANVQSAKSELRNAEIDLGYCRVVAPIGGMITRRLVDVGNLVGDGQATVLATIVKSNPIYAYMSVSESDLLMFKEQVRKGERKDYLKDTIRLDLGMGIETGYPHEGRLDYADPLVDPGTGTVQARGVFPNPDHVILPGLFVRVRVALSRSDDAMLVPERALGSDQGGRYLLVVNPKNVVETRRVTVGAAEGSMRVIEGGDLKPDDRVVINGLQKARPGVVVAPKVVEPPAPSEVEKAADPEPAG